ncbi:MAG TPA: tetratricopeptide repeat protein, partial [Dongiaceae bacterium]
ALRLDPENEATLYYRGLAYLYERQWDLSLADFNAANRLKPDDVMAIDGRGLLYRDQGRYALAEAEFAKALALRPAYPWAFFGRALLMFAEGRYGAAAEDFASSQKLGNFSAATYLPLWLYITNARDGRVTVSVLGTDNAKSDASLARHARPLLSRRAFGSGGQKGRSFRRRANRTRTVVRSGLLHRRMAPLAA